MAFESQVTATIIPTDPSDPIACQEYQRMPASLASVSAGATSHLSNSFHSSNQD